MDDTATPFGERLRQLRIQRGLSLRQLAELAHHSKTVIWEWECGTKTPPSDTVARLDALLDADGRLATAGVATVECDPQEALQRESDRLTVMLADARPGEVVSELGLITSQLAVDYLAAPGPGLIDELTKARRLAVDALRTRRLRSHQVRFLTDYIGYFSGILAYSALDAGSPHAALAHSATAWQAAEVVGNDQLRAWVRGTQSLILRFLSDYPGALTHAEDGLRYAETGSARARLLAGIGQCHANMGDPRTVRRALNDAAAALVDQRGADEVPGLFTFSQAKLLYYSGSALIWLGGGADARRARDEAHTAIGIWEHAGQERSVADEALAHVYAATGALQVRDLEAAAADLEPILSLPPERRISWIVKRTDRVAGILGQPPFDSDPGARELRERIREYG